MLARDTYNAGICYHPVLWNGLTLIVAHNKHCVCAFGSDMLVTFGYSADLFSYSRPPNCIYCWVTFDFPMLSHCFLGDWVHHVIRKLLNVCILVVGEATRAWRNKLVGGLDGLVFLVVDIFSCQVDSLL